MLDSAFDAPCRGSTSSAADSSRGKRRSPGAAPEAVAGHRSDGVKRVKKARAAGQSTALAGGKKHLRSEGIAAASGVQKSAAVAHAVAAPLPRQKKPKCDAAASAALSAQAAQPSHSVRTSFEHKNATADEAPAKPKVSKAAAAPGRGVGNVNAGNNVTAVGGAKGGAKGRAGKSGVGRGGSGTGGFGKGVSGQSGAGKAGAGRARAGKAGVGNGDAAASASEGESVLALLEQAVTAEEARRAKSLDKMRGFEAAEEERRQKKLAKERVKAEEREMLLNTVREQKRAAKAEKAKAKAKTTGKARAPATPAAAAGKPRKRVTFSPQLES